MSLGDQLDDRAARGLEGENDGDAAKGWRILIESKPLLVLAAALALFHLGNGAMLPLYGLAVSAAKKGNPASLVAQTVVVAFVSPERPRVPTGMLPGQGCERELLDPAKRDSAFLVDDAVHELGTAFNLAGRGLVVIGSCSHRGIINTVRQAQAVSGIGKVHAIVGGFHLVPPQSRDQALETVLLMQAIDPDVIIPGHCSGETFIAAAQAAMPGKVLRSIVGTRYLLGRA